MRGELFYENEWTDEQTDMIKVTVAFWNFANAPRNGYAVLHVSLWCEASHLHDSFPVVKCIKLRYVLANNLINVICKLQLKFEIPCDNW